MEYSELIKIIFNPVANFINDINKKLHTGITFPAKDENGQWRIPYGYWDIEMNRFDREHKPIIDARLLIRNFFKQLGPDIRQDIENDMMSHYMKLIVALIKLRGKQEVNHIFPYIDSVREYLNTLKNTIEPAPGQPKTKKLYDSLDRARGYCLGIAFEEGKIPENLFEEKAGLKALAVEKFELNNNLNKELKDPGQKVYVHFRDYFKRSGGPKSPFIRDQHNMDLTYAKVLFDEIFKD